MLKGRMGLEKAPFVFAARMSPGFKGGSGMS